MIKIVKDGNHKFYFDNLPNRNFEYLANVSLKNGVAYLNTKSQKRLGKQWIDANTNNAKAQLDYTDKKLINGALKWEAYSFSEHWTISEKIRLGLRINVKQIVHAMNWISTTR